MTPTPPRSTPNCADLHAAFALHNRAPMRLALLAAAVVLAAPWSARADLPASGTCNGTTMPAMMGSVGLAVKQANGTLVTVPNSYYNSTMGGVFGLAECDCSGDPNDLFLAIKL